MLSDQYPCILCFKRPKIKTSGFGVKKGLLIKKAPTEKMKDLMVPQINLRKVQNLGLFYVKGKGQGRGNRYLMTADTWAPAGVPGRL